MPTVTRDALFKAAIKVHAKRRLGQNFLIEPRVLGEIVSHLDLKAGDPVLEIGPGLGFLTQELLDAGARVYAVELDRDMIEHLGSIKDPNLTVIHRDFLNFDLSEIPLGGKKLKVVGNVPYQITSPIISHVFGEIGQPSPWFNNLESLTMTVQKEVAVRLSAKPGSKDYGQLTLLANYLTDTKLIMHVSRELFVPKPDVESAVVQMKALTKPTIKCVDPLFLRQVIKAGFKERRKMLRNNLSFTKFSQEAILAVFERLDIAPSARAENLPLSTFAMLSDALLELRNAGKQDY